MKIQKHKNIITGEKVFLALESIFRALRALLGLNCPHQPHLGTHPHPLPGAPFEVRHGGTVFLRVAL